jgi:hypothetical protein
MEVAALLVYNGKESWRGSGKQDRGNKPDSGAWEIPNKKRKEVVMLRWALGFFIVALLAALLGSQELQWPRQGSRRFSSLSSWFFFLYRCWVISCVELETGRTRALSISNKVLK